MIENIEVRSFQSLRQADIRLGRLTVITGPTGSGKSALFRALRMLARNARGTSFISAGCKTCSVTAGGASWAVRLTRSSSGPNEYVAARARDGGWEPARYTKLGGRVPPEVTALLGLTDLNFARQGEAPYLLAASGPEIARELGDLTNVSLVLGAAAEANRLRKQLSRDLDAARERHERLLADVQRYALLGVQRRAVTMAEEALAAALEVSARVTRLRSLTGRLADAEAVLEQAGSLASRQAPPDLTELAEAVARRARLTGLVTELASSEAASAGHARDAGAHEAAAREAHAALHRALAEAGQCPTCGQAVA